MSDPQDHDAPHEGPIKTPKQLIWTVVASFVVPIAIIVLLVNFVATGDKSGAGTEAMSEQAVAQRIQPVGVVMLKDASAVVALRTGEQVYTAQCAACHAAGAGGCAEVRRRGRLGAAHQDRLRGPADLGAEGQGRDGGAGRRRVLRLRDRPRRGLHGQQGRRQVRRTQGTGRRSFGRQRAEVGFAAP